MLLDAFLAGLAGEFPALPFERAESGSSSRQQSRSHLPVGERLAHRLTRFWLDRSSHPAFDFAGALRRLVAGFPLDEALIERLAAANQLPDGRDVFSLYSALQALARAPNANALAALAGAHPVPRSPVPDLPCVAALGRAVADLLAVAADVAVARVAASEAGRERLLRAAQRRLLELSEARPVDLLPHDRRLMHDAARAMRDILTLSGDALDRAVAATPVRSFYVTGPPVLGEQLVGREPLLARVDALWAPQSRSAWKPLVLYGHRRMGKTSLLHGLAERYAPHAVVAVVSAQGLSFSDGRAAVLRELALRLVATARGRGVEVPEPAQAAFAAGPWPTLRALLGHVHERSGRRVVLCLDEFEYLGREPQLLDQLRALHTEEAWFTPVLAGLHDLTDPFLQGEGGYAQLVADAERLQVGVLARRDARRLLTAPHPDADLAFQPAAEDRLLAESAGLAYLIQQMGQLAVESVNDRLKLGSPDRTCTLPDAAHAVGPALFEPARPYFDGVWTQATERDGAAAIVRALAEADGPLTLDELVPASASSPHGAAEQTARLVHLDILRRLPAAPLTCESPSDQPLVEPDAFDFLVPPMRRWLRHARPWQGV